MNKLNVAVLFGGDSPEHEVSVITGLQVIEKVDRSKFNVFPIYIKQDGTFWFYSKLVKRSDFKRTKPIPIYFSKDENGSYIASSGILLKTKKNIDSAYLAFHGGNGESGQIQGMLDVFGVPYTSSSVEGSALSMNKVLTKEVLEINGIGTVPWVRVFSKEISTDLNSSVGRILKRLSLPVVIKPVHLGSSIGVKVAKNNVELKKYLLEAIQLDIEILVEKYIKGFREYNCSVRLIDNNLEASEVEEPVAKDEILSFADKYQRGGAKKTGGMASLTRKLPAPIDKKLYGEIQQTAKKVFEICRCKGMVRIDFMYYDRKLHVVEINPIPGSMAFYLWEAAGVSFTQQITDLVEQSILDFKVKQSKKLIYKTDIVEKFVAS